MADHDEDLRDRLEPLWPAQDPRGDFVERVVARLDERDVGARPDPVASPGLQRRRGARLVAIAAGLAAVAALIAFVAWPRRGAEHAPAQGSLSATAQTTVAIGDRAVAVAVAGSVLAWSVAGDGATEIHMTAGEAFYRVDRGNAFVVHTPAGDVAVTGTCFTVVVEARGTTVEVHEGSVELRDDRGVVALRPGERGHLGAGAPARRRPVPPRTALAPPIHPSTSSPPGETVARGADCYCLSDPRQLEADQALLDEWARVCRVRADMPPFADDRDAGPAEAMADQLSLTGDERRLFIEAARVLTRAADARLREIYITATGDASAAATLDDETLIEQIELTRTLGEDAHLRAALAAERAGRATPPATDRMTPYEELYRALVGLGDDFERELATRLGPARAGELRRRFGGWPGPDFEWIGCP